jgi:hypothetical protein
MRDILLLITRTNRESTKLHKYATRQEDPGKTLESISSGKLRYASIIVLPYKYRAVAILSSFDFLESNRPVVFGSHEFVHDRFLERCSGTVTRDSRQRDRGSYFSTISS